MMPSMLVAMLVFCWERQALQTKKPFKCSFLIKCLSMLDLLFF